MAKRRLVLPILLGLALTYTLTPTIATANQNVACYNNPIPGDPDGGIGPEPSGADVGFVESGQIVRTRKCSPLVHGSKRQLLSINSGATHFLFCITVDGILAWLGEVATGGEHN